MIPGIILLIPSFNFELTLLQSFLFQAMIVYGILSAYWIYKSHYRVSIVNFLVFFFLLIKVSIPFDQHQYIIGNEQLKVMQFNVLTTNHRFDKTIQDIKDINPDFISFQEVSREWATALKQGLSEEFPHFEIVQHADQSQGLAIFSKYPLNSIEIHDWSGTANISGEVIVDQSSINFLSLHTRSPTTKHKWKIRNQHIQQAASFVAKQQGEFLVLGDFNTVPWDKQMNRFKNETQLIDSRKRLTPTFPSWGPSYIAQIPIDYIFHSEGISCGSLDSIKLTSDHHAVIGEFEIL
jgi:endonuclease/exonuclease/phosphatase (EEP) superfamily protein YafD